MMTLNTEQQATGVSVLCFLRDLFTSTPRESFSRDEMLVILKLAVDDPELFPDQDQAQTLWSWELE